MSTIGSSGMGSAAASIVGLQVARARPGCGRAPARPTSAPRTARRDRAGPRARPRRASTQRLRQMRGAARRVVVVAEGQDGILGADRRAAEVGGDVGQPLEPADGMAPRLGVGMAEMVQPAIGPVIIEVTATPSAAQALGHAVRQCAAPAAAGQAGSMNSCVSCMRPIPTSPASTPHQLLGLGEAVHEGVGAQRQRETHAPLLPGRRAARPRIARPEGSRLKKFCNC